MVSVRGRRVLVTGGTSGIGEATVRLLLEQGASVAYCGLPSRAADELAEELSLHHESVFFEALDLSDLEAARAFVRNAAQALSGLDVVVNNAGTNFFHGVLGATEQDIARCFGVDFYPAWAISREAYPHLVDAGGGVVVNVASAHAERTNPGAFPYNAAKAALVALTKSQAVEWGGDGIQAVALAPALVLTPLAEAYFQEFADPDAERKRLERQYPVKRAGRPSDLATLIAYLASGANRFISGTVLTLDGGLGAMLDPPASEAWERR